jgi:transcription elongation factor GreA
LFWKVKNEKDMEEKKFYLTKKGLEKIKKRYQELRKIRRAKSKGEVPQPFHSEEVNPEYIVFQEDVSLLENRIAKLKQILKNIRLIKSPPRAKQSIVDIGAEVLLETKNGQTNKFKIVGSLEADPSLGMISDESPLGQILLGHKTGDKVVVQTSVKTAYKIKKIKYNT